MPKLLILADDFTGAMDTGVQIAQKGIDTRVAIGTDPAVLYEADVQVLVVDTESRHLSPEQAYEIASSMARAAAEAGVEYLYYKIDSTFRGNIGAQMQGVFDGFSEDRVAFLPAYPALGRTSRDMRVYVNGVPLTETAYARDLLNPVHSDHIKQIIEEQADIPVLPEYEFENGSGVIVFDCETEEQMQQAAVRIAESGCRLLSGCAGFAAYLDRIIPFELHPQRRPRTFVRHLAVSGSVHPNSLLQLRTAEAACGEVLRLSDALKLCSEPLCHPESELLLRQLLWRLEGSAAMLASITDREQFEAFEQEARRCGYTAQQAAASISKTLAELTASLLARVGESALTVFGGDTAVAIMRELGIRSFEPVCELQPGIPYCELEHNGKTIGLVTKAGGFGEPDVLLQIDRMLRQTIPSEE